MLHCDKTLWTFENTRKCKKHEPHSLVFTNARRVFITVNPQCNTRRGGFFICSLRGKRFCAVQEQKRSPPPPPPSYFCSGLSFRARKTPKTRPFFALCSTETQATLFVK